MAFSQSNHRHSQSVLDLISSKTDKAIEQDYPRICRRQPRELHRSTSLSLRNPWNALLVLQDARIIDRRLSCFAAGASLTPHNLNSGKWKEKLKNRLTFGGEGMGESSKEPREKSRQRW